jgi:hypothetical protein
MHFSKYRDEFNVLLFVGKILYSVIHQNNINLFIKMKNGKWISQFFEEYDSTK